MDGTLLLIVIVALAVCGAILIPNRSAPAVNSAGPTPTTLAVEAIKEAVMGGPAVEEWEHGFKTERVKAARYTNPTVGYNIGFDFPKDWNNADRAEVGDFMESHGGWIYQGGGYPGATAYVKFKDVTDRQSADSKLREILPALDTLMVDMAAGKKIVIAKPKPEYEWPNTAPPRDGEWGGALSVNGTHYKKQEVDPGK